MSERMAVIILLNFLSSDYTMKPEVTGLEMLKSYFFEFQNQM